MDLVEAAGELYAGPLADFVSARSVLAKSARATGDRSLAASIGTLRKPSTAAWAVNMAVRHRPEAVEAVLVLGASLRDAQRDLDGARIRELSREALRLVGVAVAATRDLAVELGTRLSDSVETDVEQTLRAAMADPDATAAIRTGRLVAALPPAGLGGLDLSTVVGVVGAVEAPLPVAAPPPPDPSVATVRRLRAVERAFDDAQHAVRATTAAVEAAEARQSEAHRLVQRRRKELRAAEGELNERERDTRRAADALLAAEDTAADAASALAALQSRCTGSNP